ncbi:transport protein particle component [Encephalitozoon cuniculi EcunIII-L]|uniref:4-vinyl reductase 4VR domain-containing protein n=1 Tax=Encephalitozoon cuniculi TaxID=6035 RepID=M1K3Y6_ENCCN|nr:hypothetical protein ECU02_0970 [Encephalitozoon cuniculi]KMV66615.1 transport protein particle component [Encephalitozoon cuniculi EcunIII-L]UYI28290.1 trafficking protein complex subunit [Encephalitozoon cuniculi]
MSKRNEDQVNYNVFALIYTSFVNKVIRDRADRSKERLFAIGLRIGERMADDFFLVSKPRKPMSLVDVSRDISESFFPHYFSLRPTCNGCIIGLGKFPVLQYTKKEEECLEMICGILQSVYSHVSRDSIKFEAMEHNGEHCIVVRKKTDLAGPSVVGLREEASEES